MGYTECTTEETTQDLRDDQVAETRESLFSFLRTCQVGGEAFIQRTCETNPITIIELKEKPECEKVEKVKVTDQYFAATTFPTIQEVCEKMWIPEAPFWKDTNCQ